jgi:predicted ester cyclase
MNKKQIVFSFIEKVMNNGMLDELEDYLDVNFVNHSLPLGLTNDIAGTKGWLQLTSKSFCHQTMVEDIIAEDNKVFIRINMKLKHIGKWKSYPATGKEILTTGYRLFEFAGDKIIAQWASIDTSVIEQAIRDAN